MKNPYKINFDNEIICCQRKHHKKDCAFEMHWHDFIEVEIILSGEAEHICNSQISDVKKGYAYIITPHDFHALHAKTDITLLNITFDANILNDEIKEALNFVGDKNIYGEFDGGELIKKEAMFELISEEQKKHAFLSDVLSKAVLYQIIIDILRLSDNTPGKTQSTLVSKAISFVHANFREPLSVAELSSAFSVSPNYMGKLFYEHTGMSFNEYLNELRLKYACNMLRFSELSAKDISVMSGYSSVEYFFFVFKKQIGMTPGEYRKKSKL